MGLKEPSDGPLVDGWRWLWVFDGLLTSGLFWLIESQQWLSSNIEINNVVRHPMLKTGNQPPTLFVSVYVAGCRPSSDNVEGALALLTGTVTRTMALRDRGRVTGSRLLRTEISA